VYSDGGITRKGSASREGSGASGALEVYANLKGLGARPITTVILSSPLGPIILYH